MTAERCAEITLQAADKRRRAVLMDPVGWRPGSGRWPRACWTGW